VVKFIESNWGLPAQGNGAADGPAGSLDSLFNFNGPTAPPLFLNPSTGEPSQNQGGNSQS
jgi:phospholipase C